CGGGPPPASGIAQRRGHSDTWDTMIAAERERRAADRLLADVRQVSRPRVPGARRLEVEVGDEFARLLVFALSGAQERRGLGLCHPYEEPLPGVPASCWMPDQRIHRAGIAFVHRTR